MLNKQTQEAGITDHRLIHEYIVITLTEGNHKVLRSSTNSLELIKRGYQLIILSTAEFTAFKAAYSMTNNLWEALLYAIPAEFKELTGYESDTAFSPL